MVHYLPRRRRGNWVKITLILTEISSGAFSVWLLGSLGGHSHETYGRKTPTCGAPHSRNSTSVYVGWVSGCKESLKRNIGFMRALNMEDEVLQGHNKSVKNSSTGIIKNQSNWESLLNIEVCGRTWNGSGRFP